MTGRKVVAAATVALFSGGFVATVRYAAGRERPRLAHQLPNTAAVVIGNSRVALPRRIDMPAVVIYVRHDCAHCGAELGRWRSLEAGAPSIARQVDLVVVDEAAPRAGADTAVRVAGATEAIDPSAEFARSIGISGVPTTLYIRPDGVIVSATVGETSVESIRHHWSELLAETQHEELR